jgi:hypothetical protein
MFDMIYRASQGGGGPCVKQPEKSLEAHNSDQERYRKSIGTMNMFFFREKQYLPG